MVKIFILRFCYKGFKFATRENDLDTPDVCFASLLSSGLPCL